jgi:hypothetical protein
VSKEYQEHPVKMVAKENQVETVLMEYLVEMAQTDYQASQGPKASPVRPARRVKKLETMK